MSKTCTKCKETKDISLFNKDKNRKDGLFPQCKGCVAVSNKAWRDKNKERKAAMDAAWQRNNKDKVATKQKRYYEKNKDAAADRQRRWWAKTTPEFRAEYYARAQQRHQNDPNWTDKVAKLKRDWLAANPHKNYEYIVARRARVKGATVYPMPDGYRELVFNFYGRICIVPDCQESQELHIDHVVPLAAGGEHAIWNLVPMCAHHNTSKGARDSTDYRTTKMFGVLEQ